MARIKMNMQLNTFGHCIDQTALSPKVKGQLKQKKLIMSGKVLKVMVSNDIERNHLIRHAMEVLSKRLEIVVLISIKSYSKQMIMIKNKTWLL